MISTIVEAFLYAAGCFAFCRRSVGNVNALFVRRNCALPNCRRCNWICFYDYDGDGRVMFERILWLSCLVAATAIIVLGVQEINALRSRVLTAEAIIFDWRENYVIWPKAGLKTK